MAMDKCESVHPPEIARSWTAAFNAYALTFAEAAQRLREAVAQRACS